MYDIPASCAARWHAAPHPIEYSAEGKMSLVFTRDDMPTRVVLHVPFYVCWERNDRLPTLDDDMILFEIMDSLRELVTRYLPDADASEIIEHVSIDRVVETM